MTTDQSIVVLLMLLLTISWGAIVAVAFLVVDVHFLRKRMKELEERRDFRH